MAKIGNKSPRGRRAGKSKKSTKSPRGRRAGKIMKRKKGGKSGSAAGGAEAR